MKRHLIALLALLCVLSGCGASAPPEAVPDEEPQAPAEDSQQDASVLEGASTFSAAAPEELTYVVELQTLEDSVLAEDGTELIHVNYQLPEMKVALTDGTAVTEAATPVEMAALEATERFNSQFGVWADMDGLDEMASVAKEDRAFQEESGFPWNPHALELDCSVYQTNQLVSVQATYYTYTGGAHPNTVLMAWNFDLTTGQFFTPELLAEDGQAFSEGVQAVLLAQSKERAADNDMAPEDFFWSNYQEILACWSSYAVSFDETGMTVGFSPYELASYAAGPQVYHLSYSQIAGYLSDHGRGLLGLDSAE